MQCQSLGSCWERVAWGGGAVPGLGKLLGESGLRGYSARCGLFSGSRARWKCCGVRRTVLFPVGPAGVTGSHLGFWETSAFLWASRHPLVHGQEEGESPFLPKPPAALRPAPPSWCFPHVPLTPSPRGTFKLLGHLLNIKFTQCSKEYSMFLEHHSVLSRLERSQSLC